ncbi:MAG TPA: TonB family protein [Pyrinomonadaceae bacterium]
MRHTRRRKPRRVALLALGLCLLSCLAPVAPAGAQDATPPKVVASQAPAYPRVAEHVRAVGKVVVEVVLDAAGGVTSAQSKGGHPLLVKPAEEAARRWRFEPAPRGEATRTARLTFDFNLDELSCDGAPVHRSPYHLEVRPAFRMQEFSDTVSYVPADFKGQDCPLHRRALRRDKVEIIYGLVEFQPEDLKAERWHFPYANTESFGGCVVEVLESPCDGRSVQLSPRFAELLYCDECRAAKERWLKRRPW